MFFFRQRPEQNKEVEYTLQKAMITFDKHQHHIYSTGLDQYVSHLLESE